MAELYAALSAEATDSNHPAHTYFVERYAWVERLLTDVGNELIATSALRPGIAARTFARNVTAVLDGLQLQWLLRPEVDMVAEAVAFLNTQLEAPLTRTPGVSR